MMKPFWKMSQINQEANQDVYGRREIFGKWQMHQKYHVLS